MGGVLESFGVIAVVIGVGYLVAHLGILRGDSQLVLSRLVFFVASPALLFSLLSDVDAVEVLSSRLAVAVIGFAITAVVAVAFARMAWRLSRGDTVIATLCAAYVNSGNLGIPIAVYALDDASAVASVMLFQLLVVSPVAFLLLDQDSTGRRLSLVKTVWLAFRNPITVGSLLGLLVAITGVDLPFALTEPIDMIAAMAVPGMLIAYGVSLRLGPELADGAPRKQVAVLTVLKLAVQPASAYACGLLLGLDGKALMAVTVVAALPTAQNIFVYATRYGRSPVLARDSILVTTLLSVPVVVLIVALLA